MFIQLTEIVNYEKVKYNTIKVSYRYKILNSVFQ